MVQGPSQGYFPEPNKSILVQSPRNPQRVDAYFRGMRVRVFTISYYLGGFIGDPGSEKVWLDKRVKGWTDSEEVLAEVVRIHLQRSYTGLENSF